MQYSDYLWIKLGVFVLLAFLWGLYCGITGRPLGRGKSESQEEQDPKR